MSKKGILKAATLGLMTFASGEATAQTNTDDIKNKTEEITPDTKSFPEEHIKKAMENVPLGTITKVKTVDIKGRKVKILKKQQLTLGYLNQLVASQDQMQPGSENMRHPDINTVKHKRTEQDLLTACGKFCFDMDNLHKSYLNDNELMIFTESSFMIGNLKDNKGIGISSNGFFAGIEYSHIEDPDGRQGVSITHNAPETLKNPDMSRYVSYYRHVIENSEDSALVKGAQPFLLQLNKQYPGTKEEVKSSTLGLDNPNNPFYHIVKDREAGK